MTEEQRKIDQFLSAETYAVAGASPRHLKYGNKIFRALLELGRKTYPLNPHFDEVEGVPAYRTIADIPEPIESLSIVTPPVVTEQIVRQAIEAKVKTIWMQPGTEHEGAIRAAEDAGVDVIAGGACVLIDLRTR